MSAKVLDGKAIAVEVRAEIAQKTRDFQSRTGVTPHLAAVIVGDDPASHVYVKSKRKACEQVGLASSLHVLPASTSPSELRSLVDRLNADASVHGILVQLPLPSGFEEKELLSAIDPRKDVDAFHPINVGLIAEGTPRFLPCTPAGVVEILAREGIAIRGAEVVIVGRSNLVGRPLSLMLSQKGDRADATVTLCHSRTRDIGTHCRRADILVAAIGVPRFIQADMVKPGATVIDVGINRLSDGSLVGDVDYKACLQVAGAITPVPGGVGQMTVTMLLESTLKAAELQCQDAPSGGA